MKLKNLNILGFRGFNEHQTIDLDGELIIYCGANGSGKSSIAEALEWAIFGFTLRREKGDSISKREYEGSYKNVHYKGTELPSVELQFIDQNGGDRTLKRELNLDESTNLYVDNKACSELGCLNITNLRDRPIILQHSLHDFIYMKPKERYEILSRMLGLDDLISFRSTIDAVRNNFQKSYPVEVKNRIYTAKLIISKLETNPITKVVATLLSKNDVDAARDQLFAISEGRISGKISKPEELLGKLKSEYTLKQRSRLDWGSFSFQKISLDGDHFVVQENSVYSEKLKNLTESVGKLVLQVANEKTADGDTRYLEFLRVGLNFLDTDTSKCPFCSAQSLTPERLHQIKEISNRSPSVQKLISKVEGAISDMLIGLSNGWEKILGKLPKLPSDEEQGRISELANKNIDEKSAFVEQIKKVQLKIKEATVLRESICEMLQVWRGAISGDIGETLPDFNEQFEKYMTTLNELGECLNDYSVSYNELDSIISSSLSSTSDVEMLAVLIETIEKWPQINYLKYLDSVNEKLLELVKITRLHIEEKQKYILGLRDNEIRGWYDLMNPGAGVGYDSIVPTTDALELKGKTFGQMMMAAPNLSTAQLNCVGLAINLACITRQDAPYKFIVIDDPIQSMDDEHTEAFKKSVIEKLAKMGFQIVILTQLGRYGENIEALYRLSIDNTCLYQISSYQINGPIIEYKGGGLVELLGNIRKNKDAQNSDYKKAAVQDMRRFVERFVKDLYVSETRKSVSKRYQNAAWPRLNELLRECSKFEANDESKLKDTHDFTSKYLHDDNTLGQTLPASSQLKPHYDALESVKNKYKGILGIN